MHNRPTGFLSIRHSVTTRYCLQRTARRPNLSGLALLSALVLIGLGGCQTASVPVAVPVPAAEAPAAEQPPLGLPREPRVFYLLPKKSVIRLKVYPGGRLAHLGHHHLIITDQVRGLIQWHPNPAKSGFTLLIPVAGLMVDPAAARQAAGPEFSKTVSDKDILGTRRNMLGPKVLDAENFPFIEVRSHHLSGTPPQLSAEFNITIKGVTQQIIAPISLTREGDEIKAIGQLPLSQQAFGITPFSLLGGALAVQDRIWIEYEMRVNYPLGITD